MSAYKNGFRSVKHVHAYLGKLFHIHLVGVRHPVGVRPDDRRCDDLEHEPVVRRAFFARKVQAKVALDGGFPHGDVRRVRLSEKEGVVCVPVELYVVEYIGEKTARSISSKLPTASSSSPSMSPSSISALSAPRLS